MNRSFTCFASVISEIQQSDIYLTVKARLLETPRANLNGVRVTAAFVDEIIANEQKYVGLPLCADIKNLANGDYKHLGHLYDARTGEFHSAQIGSFYRFEKEELTDGAALIGYARIMKRNKAVCRAISELFADNSLKFSFEISCGSYRELDDGTIEIDANENNYLEGAAVVSFPACENAVALDLVAECNQIADDTRKGEDTMTDVIETIVSEEQNVEEPASVEEVAEAEEVTQTEELAEQQEDDSDEDEEVEEEEEAVEPEKEEVAEAESIAEVVVVEHHVSVDDVTVYDTDDGSRVEERVTHETTVEHLAEDEAAKEETAKQPEEEFVAEEVEVPDYAKMIAELKETIESLKNEISELKKETIVAEVVTSSVAQTVNPFVADVPMEKKYSLLEPEEKVQTYTLL